VVSHVYYGSEIPNNIKYLLIRTPYKSILNHKAID
jgi:hypothetical protein